MISLVALDPAGSTNRERRKSQDSRLVFFYEVFVMRFHPELYKATLLTIRRNVLTTITIIKLFNLYGEVACYSRFLVPGLFATKKRTTEGDS